jgi:hypothetical protein
MWGPKESVEVYRGTVFKVSVSQSVPGLEKILQSIHRCDAAESAILILYVG